jgi:RHS repeat-associated protein
MTDWEANSGRFSVKSDVICDGIVNEVKYEYNVNMQLQKLYQSFTGALTTYSSAVQYTYDAAHQNRLTGVIYPSGKTLAYQYDAFDNVSSLNEGTTPLVSYVYDGSGSPMQTVYNQPNVSLTYVNGGLDRFGRVVNHSWVKNSNALVHIVHGYDYAGNRTYRNDLVQTANSELYSYDNLGQIKSLSRGTLNANKTAVPTVNHSEAWNFDKTGNWSQYTRNGSVENRTHNKANELQGIATHDANGNMTVMPGLKGKYDAWNRLVEVKDSSDNVIATYEYNGLNQRIKKTVGGVLTKSFFNENWQEVESVTGSEMTSYVWGVRYIDDLVLREKGEERLYSLADPNWNVVALLDATGAVVERMKYDAFGKVTWLNAGFGVKAASDYAWNRTFTGQVLDGETMLMLYRNRYYHVVLGRFISVDPLKYETGDNNLYRYAGNRSLIWQDMYGLLSGELAIAGCGWGLLGSSLGSVLLAIVNYEKDGFLKGCRNVGCSALGGCMSGAIAGLFTESVVLAPLAGCAGAALGSLLESICKKGSISRCDLKASVGNLIFGCIGGFAIGGAVEVGTKSSQSSLKTEAFSAIMMAIGANVAVYSSFCGEEDVSISASSPTACCTYKSKIWGVFSKTVNCPKGRTAMGCCISNSDGWFGTREILNASLGECK